MTVFTGEASRSVTPAPGLRGLAIAEHPLAFFANGIGDALLALPTMRALAAMFSNRLTLLCPKTVRELDVFELPLKRIVELKWPDPSLTEPDGRLDPGDFDAASAAAAADQCDLFLSLVSWRSPGLAELMRRLMPHTTVGALPCYDLHGTYDERLHSADLTFTVAQVLDPHLRFADFAQPPRLPPTAVDTAARLRGHLPCNTRVLVVHPDTAPDRCWRPQCFIEALDLFLEERPDFFVMVVGLAYESLDVGRHGDRVVACLGLPLAATVALVGTADLFLGVNSSMLHAADMARVPGVGLFCPEASPCGPTRWGFRFSLHRHLIGRTAVADIEVGEVVSALLDLSSQTGEAR